MIAPGHLDIESVRGYCNADCAMCAMKASRKRPRIMPNRDFETIVAKFCDSDIYKAKSITLVGLGEPLIDNGLTAKVSYARSKGFEDICLPTNVSLLNEEKSKELLDAGLTTILFSIDSLKKETYERIRVNLNFEEVMQNAHRFIEMRDLGNYGTKIYVRIIEQEMNSGERRDYTTYWAKYLNTNDCDLILSFPAHNWADAALPIEKDCVCPYIFDRMAINAWGDVQFCCIDVEANFFNLGNVLKQNPIEIFNNKIFDKTRSLMKSGKINDIAPCRCCNLPLKRLDRRILL